MFSPNRPNYLLITITPQTLWTVSKMKRITRVFFFFLLLLVLGDPNSAFWKILLIS